MALTKDKKKEVVSEVKDLLDSSKMTVLASYKGTPVKSMQKLRKTAKDGGTTIKVVKNRLVIKAIEESQRLNEVDTGQIKGQLLYAFNTEDEVAPAQVLFQFSKEAPNIEFVGAITADGQLLPAEEVQNLANLPSKEQLKAMVVGTLKAPLTGFATAISGNMRGLTTVLKSKAEQG